MTGRIIPLRDDPHERVLALLPWFVTGRLETAERAEVEAHLAGCAHCRAEERLERRLEAEVAGLPMEAELAWARMQARIDTPAPAREAVPADWLGGGWRKARPAAAGAPRWLGWALAAQAALLVLLAAAVWPAAWPPAGPVRYHVLAAPTASSGGNALVIFRPETPERDLRAALTSAGARLVDGPTSAGAYVLRLPPATRAAAVAALRRRADIVMAEPIDSEPIAQGGPP